MKEFNGSKISLMVIGLLGLASVSLAVEDTWTYKADMPTARGFVSGCVVDGRIYIIGGFPTHDSVTAAVEMYDPTADAWTTMANMPSARCAHATCAYDGKIYVFGGTSPDPYSAAKRNVYVYDIETDSWTQKADMPYANALCGVAVVDGTIYIIGGTLSASSPPVSRVMAYDPIAESWMQRADMPTARGFLSACAAHGKIYAIGGATEDYMAFSYRHVEVYDPSTNTWTRKSDMPTGRATAGTCVVDRRVYAIGGFSPAGALTANEVYDPLADMWTTASPMQQIRVMPFVGSVGDKIYAIGGSYPPSAVLSSAEEYDTGLGAPVTDFNGDQKVDFNDFAIFAQSAYDDGELDGKGLAALAEHWLEDFRLVAHWKLDEQDGGVAADSAGDNDAALHGGPNWQPTAGSVDGAIELDGIDDYVSTDFVLDPADGPFSVHAWLKAGAADQVVISQVGATGRSWLATDSQGNLMTDIRAPVGRLFGPPLISDFLITDGDWHRIALVWDGSYRRLHADGEEVAADIEDQNALVGADGGFYFGAENTLSATGFFDGMIDDIRLYDQAVTP